MGLQGLFLAALYILDPRLAEAAGLRDGGPALKHVEDSARVNAEQNRDVAGGEPASGGRRRAIVICGHPGDDEYRKLYAQSVEQICGGLVKSYRFERDDVLGVVRRQAKGR